MTDADIPASSAFDLPKKSKAWRTFMPSAMYRSGVSRILRAVHNQQARFGVLLSVPATVPGFSFGFRLYLTKPLYTSVDAPSFLMMSLFPSASESTVSEQPSIDVLPSTDSVWVSKLTA